MSIIIVGVGPAEFDGRSQKNLSDWCNNTVSAVINWVLLVSTSAMIELDGDEIRISSRGRYAERDIVQVPVCVLSSNLDVVLKHFSILNWLKCKTRQWGVSGGLESHLISGGWTWRDRAVCVQAFCIVYGKQPKQHLSPVRGLFRIVTWSPRPLHVRDHRWHHAHTRSKWHSPSICEESDRAAFFSLYWEFR